MFIVTILKMCLTIEINDSKKKKRKCNENKIICLIISFIDSMFIIYQYHGYFLFKFLSPFTKTWLLNIPKKKYSFVIALVIIGDLLIFFNKKNRYTIS